MKFRPETITAAMDLCHTSKSLRKARNWLERHWNEFPKSHVSIWRWVQKYSQLVGDFVEVLEPQTSDEWLADEMVLFVGGKWSWNWEVMDSRTRFWLASKITEGRDRTVEDAEAVLSKARERAEGRPEKLVTDGLPAYRRGISWSLGWRQCEHVVELSWKEGKHRTNPIERKVQTTRMRLKTMRCLESLETGQNRLKGAKIHYNFVRPHMSLGGTPAEAAGLNLDLGRDKWLSLIRLSSKIFILIYLPITEQSP